MTANMRPQRCLVFTDDNGEQEAVNALAEMLAEHSIRVTVCVERSKCLDLLDAGCWAFLVIGTMGDADSSLDVLADASRICPGVPSLVLVRRGEIATAVQAIKAGAADCLEVPVDAARLPSVIAFLQMQRNQGLGCLYAVLTRVERIVLRYVLEGRTSSQIAQAMSRSPRTIHVHRRNIMAKLGVASVVDLVKLERRQRGLVVCPSCAASSVSEPVTRVNFRRVVEELGSTDTTSVAS